MNILRSTKMDFSGSTEDPHTFAKPEQARVTDIHLELIVDFKQKVLKGKAILTIKKKSSISGIFLDNYGLIISRVTNIDGTDLDYHVGIHHIFGSSFYVELPPTVDTTCNSNNECKIEIEYKTSSDSPALYWLTSAQTANGTHPFLLSNNKVNKDIFPH
ncbi:leukotriene A-4 hydrolase-like [Temnothorax longispinosus]|uniref:leukotriene A-4 hydrolase-like n=1 Tax=Temnothorax longispinosus TaxID=300112 RepID=UPI003A993C3F